MTTITATLIVTLDGAGETVDAVARHLADWLRRDGALMIETALRDEAYPEYDDDWDEGDEPTEKMITYEAWNSSYWRMDVAVDQVRLVSPQLPLLPDDQGAP